MGSPTGTISDFDGKFTLNVPEGEKLSVSYIGYLSQVVTPKSNVVNVTLVEDNQKLNEVVVVGYGTQKMKNVTGSVSTISAKELEDLPVTTLAEALQGEINGLSVDLGSSRPGGALNNQVYIRQAKTLNGLSKDGGDNIPLIIIDDVIQLGTNGQPSMEQFNLLDPSEVETITVLRDASAAIYGSRAANGAILVKTKRGKSGVPRISYSGKFAISDAISHSKVLKGSDYGRFHNSFLIASNKAKRSETSKLFGDEEIAELDNLNYDWLDEAGWEAAFNQTHTLNVSGGSERATYFAGASYMNQGANLGKQDYQRFTYRAGVDVKLTTDVKLSASISGNEGESNSIYTKGARFNAYGGSAGEKADYNVLHHIPNYMPWSVELENEAGEMEKYWLSPYGNYYSNPSFDRSSPNTWNYFALINNGSYNNDKRNSWNTNISLTYEVPFVKGLTIRANYASSHATSLNEQAAFPYELAYMKKLPKENQHLPTNMPIENIDTKVFDKDTKLNYLDMVSESRQYNFYVNYDGKFGGHSIAAMFAVERSESEYSERRIAFENLASDMSDTFLGTAGPSIVDKDGNPALSPDNTVVNKGESGSLSYLGRVSYSYLDRYMLQFIFRSDASTKFAPENYWGFFPGISAGWVISEENWFKEKLSWMEYMKIRLSWGRTGRDNIKAWKWKQFYGTKLEGMSFGENGGNRGTRLLPNTSPNRNVKWDTVDKFNLGFDMRFLNGRLGATLDMYYDMNDDILNKDLASQPGIPIYAGGQYAEENWGRVDTYGAEISLTWRDQIGKFKYNVGLDYGINDSRIKKWVPGLRKNAYPSSTGWEEGMSTTFAKYGFKVWKGTSTGDGILRTQADIDNYWNYLTEHATAAGTEPKYFGKGNKDDLKLGMLAYQDLGGEMKDGVQQAPNGQINKDQDYTRLCGRKDSQGFTTRLGGSWNNLSFKINIATSWGGVRFIDRVDIKNGGKDMIWSPDSFWKDMYDEETNPNGAYPNLGVDRLIGGSALADSDFWAIETFRCYVRNLTIAYSLPKKWIAPLKMESVRLNLSGNNLWDLYNPYPDHYRNMYNNGSIDYPTLRTWSLGVNVSF